MISALIFILTCILIIISVLFKPKIKIVKIELSSYWIIALLGAITVSLINHEHIRNNIAALLSPSAVNPVKVLVLFISMTFISVFLDGTGLFSYLAGKVLSRSGKNQFRLFLYLYLTVSVLTVFTSNDIIILTFTPFICYFCKRAGISPLPYLFGEFTAANTWSMFLIIGNPTNIYLASYFDTGFLEYIKVMAVPTVFSGVTSFIVLCILFRKQLSMPMNDAENTKAFIHSKPLMITGIIHLLLCTVILSVSSYIGLEMWYTAFFFAISLCVCTLIYSIIKKEMPMTLLIAAERIPWQLIPFVLSMFILVLEFETTGIPRLLGNMLNSLGNTGTIYSFASAICANFLNNIPMSVLFGTIISSSNALPSAIYGAIAGSNIGALLTPAGALAGIMWTDILSSHGLKLSAKDFIKYGSAIAIPALAAASVGLALF